MDYEKVYNNLINKARDRGLNKKLINHYTEFHHILPKSLGGGEDQSNKVLLSLREHFLAHWLLYKIHKNQATAFAWYAMTFNNGKREVFNSRSFEYARMAASLQMKESRLKENNPMYGRVGDSSSNFKGYFITPKGRFGSCYEAAKVHSVSKSTIHRRCTENKIIRNTRSGVKGKTWRELGWYFEEVK